MMFLIYWGIPETDNQTDKNWYESSTVNSLNFNLFNVQLKLLHFNFYWASSDNNSQYFFKFYHKHLEYLDASIKLLLKIILIFEKFSLYVFIQWEEISI